MSQKLINFKFQASTNLNSINMFFLAVSGIEAKLVEKPPTQFIWVDNFQLRPIWTAFTVYGHDFLMYNRQRGMDP